MFVWPGIALPPSGHFVADIFAEGKPEKLRKFLENGRLVFVGKSICGDIAKTASILGISTEIRDKAKYIELDQLFDFTLHVLTNYDQAHAFLRATVDERKNFWSCIGEPSLKTVCRLAWPEMTLRKLHEHRNHLNNFDEWDGK